MAIYNLGSINVDHFYAVAHLPAPGETIAALEYRVGLGGKGANQSVAAARAGATVRHLGSIGIDADWIKERLGSYGVDVSHVASIDAPTGHAIINVAQDGENAIVIVAGANGQQSSERIEAALRGATAGDFLLLQNETNLQAEVARIANSAGLRVAYSAAPFDAEQVKAVLPHAHTILLNEIEARQLETATGRPMAALPVENVVVTLGSKGARLITPRTGNVIEIAGHQVDAVDTTAAGDTFAGYLVAALDEGLPPDAAMRLAGAAAALKVTRAGTADAIPARDEVTEYLKSRD